MYAATSLKKARNIEFITALLPNHSNLPQNQLAVYVERPGQFAWECVKIRISIGPGGRWRAHALRIAVSMHRWFLSRPEDLASIGLVLLKDCVLDVGPFPDFGRCSVARDVSSDDVVVGRGRGVFIKCNNSTSKRDDLDYGRSRETCNHQEVSRETVHLRSSPTFFGVFGRIFSVVVMVFVAMLGGSVPQTGQWSGSV